MPTKDYYKDILSLPPVRLDSENPQPLFNRESFEQGAKGVALGLATSRIPLLGRLLGGKKAVGAAKVAKDRLKADVKGSRNIDSRIAAAQQRAQQRGAGKSRTTASSATPVGKKPLLTKKRVALGTGAATLASVGPLIPDLIKTFRGEGQSERPDPEDILDAAEGRYEKFLSQQSVPDLRLSRSGAGDLPAITKQFLDTFGVQRRSELETDRFTANPGNASAIFEGRTQTPDGRNIRSFSDNPAIASGIRSPKSAAELQEIFGVSQRTPDAPAQLTPAQQLVNQYSDAQGNVDLARNQLSNFTLRNEGQGRITQSPEFASLQQNLQAALAQLPSASGVPGAIGDITSAQVNQAGEANSAKLGLAQELIKSLSGENAASFSVGERGQIIEALSGLLGDQPDVLAALKKTSSVDLGNVDPNQLRLVKAQIAQQRPNLNAAQLDQLALQYIGQQAQ